MVKKMVLAIALFTVYQSVAQQKEAFVTPGLLKANLSFNQSIMLFHKSNNVYLGGNLEYFTSRNLSFRGDCLWYLDTRQKEPVLKRNAVVLFGALLHLPKGKSDFFAGVQPGFSFSQPQPSAVYDHAYPTRMMPAFGLTAGYSLYFSKFCHFIFGMNYLVSRYRGAESGSIKLDEFMITGGLGFHVVTKKQKPEN